MDKSSKQGFFLSLADIINEKQNEDLKDYMEDLYN